MAKKLKDYATENGISHVTAWRHFKAGMIPNAKMEHGVVIIDDPKPASISIPRVNLAEPSMAVYSSKAATTKTRTNKSATIKTPDRYENIENGVIPYTFSNIAVNNTSEVSIRDTVLLCQKAYWNFALVKNVIDMMTEFSISPIYFRNGNAKSRKFFSEWLELINNWDLQDQFYREWYRSGNNFLYKASSSVDSVNLKQLQETYASEIKAVDEKLNIPYRYIILNPADIVSDNSLGFIQSRYFKVLNNYELERLKNPKTEQDQEFFDNLPAIVKKEVKKGGRVLLPLDENKISAIFCKKQDYEDFAVPMVYPVLDDIEFILELKKMDLALARTCQQIVLLITMGYEGKDGSYNVNANALTTMRELFENESIGRVLVADFTTKAQFVIPQIADILNPQKYAVVERSLREGLNSIISSSDSGEKFANQSIKIKVFIERLKHGRQAFISQFLQPEINKIAKNMGFKNIPEAYCQEFDFEDSMQWARIYTRLAEIGMLAPEETLQAIDNGKLPTPEENLEAQKRFKENKDNGLYQPLIGGAKIEENGRPAGTKAPQSTKNVKPIGTSKATYSLSKVKDNIILFNKLQDKIEGKLLKKHKLEKLNEQQKEIANMLSQTVISSEPPENWLNKIDDYLQNPMLSNAEITKQIDEIAAEHQLTSQTAAILFHSEN